MSYRQQHNNGQLIRWVVGFILLSLLLGFALSHYQRKHGQVMGKGEINALSEGK